MHLLMDTGLLLKQSFDLEVVAPHANLYFQAQSLMSDM